MRILLLTDIHYGENTRYPKYPGDATVANFGERLEEYGDRLRSIARECDLVVNLGDLIEQTETAAADKERYRTAATLLDFGIPILHVVGNHDVVNLDRKTMAGMIGKSGISYALDFLGYHCVVLDGNRDRKTRPEPFRFDVDQIDWLREDVRQTSLPVLVFSHYPIAPYDLTSNPLFRTLGPEKAFPLRSEIVQEILEKSGKVLAVVSGHMHYAHKEIVRGILHHTIGSFTLNNGQGMPTTEYAIAVVQGTRVTIEEKRVTGRS
jgi:3',5'-cyclic-AMP phosphodiesterase